jgi:hypothetical protein
VMALKKGCGGVPKESKGGQGCGTTVSEERLDILTMIMAKAQRKTKEAS